jgi:pyruvate dehydrogenase E2 component (dihydrolipoamide acetyltransferase)
VAELLLVPEVAAGAAEVVFSEWLAEPGTKVKAGDPIAVIETEKAVVEVVAEADATLLKTLVEPGSMIGVGVPMALLGSADEAGRDPDAILASLGVAAGQATSTPAPQRRDIPGLETSTSATPPGPVPTDRVFVSPIARKLLREAGLTPDGIVGTGPNGRIRRHDVEKATANATDRHAPSQRADTGTDIGVSAKPGVTAVGGWTDLPHSRLRRAIATRLTASKQQTPHFYVKRSAVLDELLALRARLNDVSEHRVSVNDFMIRAMAVAHGRMPDANVIWTDEAVRKFDTVDISVAIASERGLVTPVLRRVEQKSLSTISSAVRTFIEQANAGRLQQKDLEGGTITISNLGMYGVEEFSAIINPPQSAILAIGAGRLAPRVEGGEIVVRTVVDLVLSVDHRAIDGALAAQWMDALVTAVENPFQLIV